MSKITELVKYSVTDQALDQYREEFLHLTIAGLDDHEGYEKVKEARLFIRAERVNVEKKRVELKAESLEFGRAVDAEAKRITTAILEVEDHLTAEQKKIDDENARIKFEKEQRAVLPERIAKLAELDATMSEEQLLQMDGPTFQGVLNTFLSAKLEKQRQEQEEREKSQRAEQERIEAEKRAIEAQKIKVEQDARHKAEVEEAEKRAAERAKVEVELEAKRKEDARVAAEAEAKAEQERIEAERPDNEKLHLFAGALTALPFPDVTTKKAQAKVAKVRKLIDEIVSELQAA